MVKRLNLLLASRPYVPAPAKPLVPICRLIFCDARISVVSAGVRVTQGGTIRIWESLESAD